MPDAWRGEDARRDPGPEASPCPAIVPSPFHRSRGWLDPAKRAAGTARHAARRPAVVRSKEWDAARSRQARSVVATAVDPCSDAPEGRGELGQISGGEDFARLPGVTRSGAQPTRSATTQGNPVARASLTTRPHLRLNRSAEPGNRPRHTRAPAPIWFRKPAHAARSPSRSASARQAVISSPVPTTSTLARDPRPAIARIRSSGRFFGSSLPTKRTTKAWGSSPQEARAAIRAAGARWGDDVRAKSSLSTAWGASKTRAWIDAKMSEILARARSHAQVAIEQMEQPPRPHAPDGAAPSRRPVAQMRIAPVQGGNAGAAARPERPHQRDGVPPWDQGHVGTALLEGRADLGDVEAPEPFAVNALAMPRGAQDAASVALDERRVPLKRHAEPHALLGGGGLGPIQDRQIQLGAMRGDVAKPGRVVLHRVRQHDGQADRAITRRSSIGLPRTATRALARAPGSPPAFRPGRRRRTLRTAQWLAHARRDLRIRSPRLRLPLAHRREPPYPLASPPAAARPSTAGSGPGRSISADSSR